MGYDTLTVSSSSFTCAVNLWSCAILGFRAGTLWLWRHSWIWPNLWINAESWSSFCAFIVLWIRQCACQLHYSLWTAQKSKNKAKEVWATKILANISCLLVHWHFLCLTKKKNSRSLVHDNTLFKRRPKSGKAELCITDAKNGFFPIYK